MVMLGPNATAPGMFAQLATAYSAKHNIPMDRIKEALTHISWKSHQNGAKNPRAHLRKAATKEQIAGSPMVAYPLGLFDCCGICDGASAAIMCRTEDAKRYRPNGDYVTIKASAIACGPGWGKERVNYGYTVWEETEAAAIQAYEMAGIKDPTQSIDIIELHDAFVHQLEISMAEFGLVPLGRADALIEEGLMTPGGNYLDNPCGGLIYCGHAVGASNVMSAWSARNELIKRGLKTALVHGTGSTVSQYTACLIFEHE
jgi:acetyl-CoA C-acetyltransferase